MHGWTFIGLKSNPVYQTRVLPEVLQSSHLIVGASLGLYLQWCLKVSPSKFFIFLYKFDLKLHQIFTQVQKIDNENQIKQISQKY